MLLTALVTYRRMALRNVSDGSLDEVLLVERDSRMVGGLLEGKGEPEDGPDHSCDSCKRIEYNLVFWP